MAWFKTLIPVAGLVLATPAAAQAPSYIDCTYNLLGNGETSQTFRISNSEIVVYSPVSGWESVCKVLYATQCSVTLNAKFINVVYRPGEKSREMQIDRVTGKISFWMLERAHVGTCRRSDDPATRAAKF